MQQQEFELSMSKFFDKAGVQILKKGVDYDDVPSYPTYILLDTKRKLYYAAESDVFDGDIDDENITRFSLDASLDKNSARAFFALSKAVKAVDNKFSLNNGTDLKSLKKRYALIVSDKKSSQVKDYLGNNSYKFQSVPSKGQFLVIFIDKSMHKKLASIYSSYAGNKDLDDISPVFEPKENADTQEINLNTKNYNADNPLVTPKENKVLEDSEAEEMLENIDLNDLIKPKEVDDAPKNETEADLLYGKFLNEQTKNIEVSDSGPVEKRLDEIPEGLINDEDIKEMTSGYNSADSSSLSREEKKAAKLREKEEKKQARLTQRKERYDAESNTWLDIPGRIASNIIGILFFLPVYLLNKILGRFLPPFVLYWITAIIAIYGVYQMVIPLIPQPLNDTFQQATDSAISHMQSFSVIEDNGTKKIDELTETSINMMKSSAVMFDAFIQGIDAVTKKGILLQYLLGFAATILIIPAFRFIGKTLTIFALLSYFLLPPVAYLQSKLIMFSFSLDTVNLTAAAVTFLVYAYPVVMFFVVLFISSAIVPDKEKRREVLP